MHVHTYIRMYLCAWIWTWTLIWIWSVCVYNIYIYICTVYIYIYSIYIHMYLDMLGTIRYYFAHPHAHTVHIHYYIIYMYIFIYMCTICTSNGRTEMWFPLFLCYSSGVMKQDGRKDVASASSNLHFHHRLSQEVTAACSRICSACRHVASFDTISIVKSTLMNM